MEVNYELYKVFYTVAKLLSFSEAASELCLSQSAVSQSIKALETKLGKTLFARSTKKVSLTGDGELLMTHIEPAIEFIRRGEEILLDESAGRIRLAASDTICRYFLVPYLKRFHKRHPGVHLQIINATSAGCLELLKKNKVDLIVINHAKENHLSPYDAQVVKEFQDVFVAGSEYQDLSTKTLTFHMLQEQGLLMLDKNSTTSAFLHNEFKKNGLDLLPAIEISSNDLLLDLAKINLGIAFVPDYCLSGNDKGLFVLKTKERLPTRQLAVVYNPLQTNELTRDLII
ncbi:DNA-binding transcriptional LysR family regulator [Lachnospiraceae bacterium PF1-21]|uniref:LysR family transcriptional regulator n=1 Tax=Ohessyouella blattaphilus TaxID=2949333 RepID=UPI003E2F222E